MTYDFSSRHYAQEDIAFRLELERFAITIERLVTSPQTWRVVLAEVLRGATIGLP